MSHRRTDSSSSATHLSPYDYSGVGMGFGLYRPRRPSYTIATQVQRQRSESYRYAVAKSTADVEDPADFIEGVIQRKNRKDSYIRATRPNERPDVEMRDIKEHMKKVEEESVKTYPSTCPTSPIILINDQGPSEIEISADVYRNHEAGFPTKSNSETRNGKVSSRRASIPNALSNNYLKELKEVVEKKRYSPKHGQDLENHTLPNNFMKGKSELNQNEEETYDDAVFTCQNEMPDVTTPSSGDTRSFPSPFRSIRIRKNFVLLCVSFILVFNAFRAIQNLQSSLNSTGYLGIISLASIHGTMCLTCLWAPVLINSVTAKWTLVIGVWTHILWIAGNIYPRFYTLIPLGIIAGIGKGIIWTAESSYLVKLSYDYSRVTKEGFEREMFRFHGIFIACFQTTHIFGNLISSLVLHGARNELENPLEESNTDYVVSDENATYVIYEDYSDVGSRKSCGVLFQNKTVFSDLYSDKSKEVPSYLWKMMCAYLGLALVAFIIVMVCLDSIGARFNPEKTGYEIVVDHVRMMITHKTFRLLVPLLVFCGLQQAFVFADFTQAFVSCTIGEEYIGYCMIILGLANIVSAILVALCANLIPREVVFGIGGILHMGLMIGLLIWIPDKKLSIFFLMAASWGVCDAVWQTQCNTLICITCPDDTDMAFANYRLLQSFGLAMGFVGGTFMTVSFKLYILMILLVVAIMFYVLAEYRLKQVDADIFEGQIEVN